MAGRGTGRWTLGLYNSYDPHHFHEAMRRAIARAAPLCLAFDMNLAPIGFPFHAFRDKAGQAPERQSPEVLAGLVADSTTIGEGGEYLVELARGGRFVPTPFPQGGFPPQYGNAVLATRTPDASRRIDVRDIAARTRDGESFLLLVGLGPRGVPKDVREMAPSHLELTGAGRSLETATALGVLAGRLHEAFDQLRRPTHPRVTVDAYAERDGEVLLIRRAREPFQGRWVLPGGFVEVGETTEAAVLRELEEETGAKGRVAGIVGVYSAPDRDPRHHTVSVCYRIQLASGPIRGGSDAVEAKFWPLEGLPPLAFDHAQMVADGRGGSPRRPEAGPRSPRR